MLKGGNENVRHIIEEAMEKGASVMGTLIDAGYKIRGDNEVSMEKQSSVTDADKWLAILAEQGCCLVKDS